MLNYFNKNSKNCILNQFHSNKITFASNFKKGIRLEADGIISNKSKHNLWIYTADCIPIFFADKQKRFVAAIHCGRKGLEKRIVKQLIRIFDDLGSSKNDLIVAIGPSISCRNYLVNEKIFKEFNKNISNRKVKYSVKNKLNLFNINFSKGDFSYELDLKKNAHLQLLHENIPNRNIEISNLCTYDLKKEFHSYRRNKTNLRQWNFICTEN